MRKGGFPESTGSVFLFGRHEASISIPGRGPIPYQMHRSGWTVALLGDDDLPHSDAIGIGDRPVRVVAVVVLLSVEHHDDIGILLDRA